MVLWIEQINKKIKGVEHARYEVYTHILEKREKVQIQRDRDIKEGDISVHTRLVCFSHQLSFVHIYIYVYMNYISVCINAYIFE